jgi:PAS domain S-box-containing protein
MAIDQDLVLETGDDLSAQMKNEGRYRNILENMQDAYYEVDLAGTHIFFNDALCQILRYSREELQGLNYLEYMAQGTSAKVYEVFNEVFRTGKPRASYSYEMTAGDGKKLHVELSVALMRDEEGEPNGFQGIIRDKTEQVLAERQLKLAHTELEERVETRTAELAAVNDSLKEQIKERQEIEAALEKRNQMLEALNTLSQQASFQEDFGSILQTCVDVVGQTLEATSVYISSWDWEDDSCIVIAEYVGPDATEQENVSDLGTAYSLKDDFGKITDATGRATSTSSTRPCVALRDRPTNGHTLPNFAT